MTSRTQARSKTQTKATAEQRSEVIVFDAKAASDKLVNALEARRDQIVSFLGSDPAYAQRFLSVSIDAIVRDRNLLSADLFSLVAAVRHAAIMGLEPSSVMGEGAIVVYRDNDQGGKKIAQFQPMVRGLQKLARNSGDVNAIGVDVVHKEDDFDYVSGSDPRIDHRPFIEGDPGEVIGAYAYVRLSSGELVPMFMRTAEILKRRSVSKSYRSSGENSIWGSWPEEMMKKTVLRRLLVEKVPLSFRAQRALALDAEIDSVNGDPAKVEASVSPGRMVARLTAHLDDEAGNGSQPAEKAPPAADEVEGAAKDVAEPKAAQEPPDEVCGKPGLVEGAKCTSAKGHPGPHHNQAFGEWL